MIFDGAKLMRETLAVNEQLRGTVQNSGLCPITVYITRTRTNITALRTDSRYGILFQNGEKHSYA
jgi:hypothetical protein